MRHDQLEVEKRKNKGATTIYGALKKKQLSYIFIARVRDLLPKEEFLFIFLWINKFAYMSAVDDIISNTLSSSYASHICQYIESHFKFCWWEMKIEG